MSQAENAGGPDPSPAFDRRQPFRIRASRKPSTMEIEDCHATPVRRRNRARFRRLLRSFSASVTRLPPRRDDLSTKLWIREAIELCLEVEGAPEQDLEFVGIQRVTIAA